MEVKGNHKCLTLPLTSVQSRILLITNVQHSDHRTLTVVKCREISSSVLECQKVHFTLHFTTKGFNNKFFEKTPNLFYYQRFTL